MMAWFENLPIVARALVVVAMATALSTWIILTWLPNPLLAMMNTHIAESAIQTELLRRICENTAKTRYDAGRCGVAR